MAEQPNLLHLINGRRDTIFYSCTAALVALDLVTVGTEPLHVIHMAGHVAATRELLRLASWFAIPPQQDRRVGDTRPVINLAQCRAAVASVWSAAIAVKVSAVLLVPPEVLLNPPTTRAQVAGVITVALSAAAAAITARRAGGMRNVDRLYRDVIFDLPRKLRGDDGGTPEAQLWKDAVTSVLPALPTPRPAMTARIGTTSPSL